MAAGTRTVMVEVADAGYILEVEPIGFGMGYERKRGIKHDSLSFDLSKLKSGEVIY